MANLPSRPAAPKETRTTLAECLPMKTLLLMVGIVAVLMGLLWIGQGSGRIAWPASSFMIDQRPWVLRGAILAVVGLVLILFSRRG